MLSCNSRAICLRSFSCASISRRASPAEAARSVLHPERRRHASRTLRFLDREVYINVGSKLTLLENVAEGRGRMPNEDRVN